MSASRWDASVSAAVLASPAPEARRDETEAVSTERLLHRLSVRRMRPMGLSAVKSRTHAYAWSKTSCSRMQRASFSQRSYATRSTRSLASPSLMPATSMRSRGASAPSRWGFSSSARERGMSNSILARACGDRGTGGLWSSAAPREIRRPGGRGRGESGRSSTRRPGAYPRARTSRRSAGRVVVSARRGSCALRREVTRAASLAAHATQRKTPATVAEDFSSPKPKTFFFLSREPSISPDSGSKKRTGDAAR